MGSGGVMMAAAIAFKVEGAGLTPMARPAHVVILVAANGYAKPPAGGWSAESGLCGWPMLATCGAF